MAGNLAAAFLPARWAVVAELIRLYPFQIQLVFNDPQFVKLNFFAKQSPDEILDPTGNRKGTFEITVSVSKSDLAIHEAFFC
jgi:hypothetical protein